MTVTDTPGTMSRENVELVRQLLPSPDVDLAALFRNEDAITGVIDAATPFLDPDVEVVLGTFGPYTYGPSGLRGAWLDWLEPWATYRTEIDQVIDAGDRVVVLVHDFGRREVDAPEVDLFGANIWTFRDGKIMRLEFFPDRTVALKVAGLRE
jgi:ketosteroid isomerase-like protein